MADGAHANVTDGVDQAHRLPPALAEGYFAIDERDLVARIARLADVAGELPFQNLADQSQGTWRELLFAEDAVVMALILAERRSLREQRFVHRLERDPPAALVELFALAGDLDGWLRRLRRAHSRPGAELGRRIEELVTGQLAPELDAMLDFARAAEVDVAVPRDPAWQRPRAPSVLAQQPWDARHRLRTAYYGLLNGVAYLQRIAPPYFAECMATADHQPAAALWLAALDLFDDVRAKLERFTTRHADFYHRDVLGTRPRPATPERVLLGFPEAAGNVAIAVRKGAEVRASWPERPSGVRFAVDADAFASAARLRAAHTLLYQRDPLMSPHREMDAVTRVRVTRLPLGAAGTVERSGWSLLGGDPADVFAGEHAVVGLAFTSPCLLLREGVRRVRLHLALAPRRPADEPGAAGTEAADHAWLAAQFTALLAADPGLGAAMVETSVTDTVQRLLDSLAEGDAGADDPIARLLPEEPVQALFVRLAMRTARPERPRGFAAPFGRLMARLLLGPDRQAPPAAVDEIVAHAERVLGPRPTGEAASDHPVRRLLTEGRAYQYEKFLKDAFVLDLATADGWHRVADLGVRPLAAVGDERLGLAFAFELGRDAPPIEPNGDLARSLGLSATAPLARLTLAPDATFCAQTLLEPFVLDEIAVEVDVRGLRDVRISSDFGALDPSQAFQPFGPTPRIGTGFVVGGFEPAQKRLRRLTLRLEWLGLPTVPGGFDTHYRPYGEDWADASFGVEVDWLSDGVWQPLPGAAAPLFEPVTAAEVLPARARVRIDLPSATTPLPPSVAEADFAYGVAARSGFARLRLTGPPEAFGHAAYPRLLARSFGRPGWRRRPPPPPPSPYTPTLARLEIDYRARTSIRLGEVPAETARARGEVAVHLSPFGVERIHPDPVRSRPGALPVRAVDGALHLGIERLRPGQPVSLLFHMAERAQRRRAGDPPPIGWSYLSALGWTDVPTDHVVADTTSGLMRSGVVSLQVPADATLAGSGMPAGVVWLRVGADSDLQAFPRLAALVVNGVSATRLEEDAATALPTKPQWRMAMPVPGLETIHQLGQPTGGLPGETGAQFHARVGERVRHRGRAVTAWDYERLVLDRFPEVWKVKCFPAMDDRDPERPAPGRVLVVVVPQASAAPEAERFEARMFDLLSLDRIREALVALAPATARLEVRNPSYDLIQVRARVRFVDAADQAWLVRVLGDELAGYLSPWDETGTSLGFGWQLNAEDVEGFVAERDYVESVSEFAMLMLTTDDVAFHHLDDTARPAPAVNDPGLGILRHSVPWSLPLPLRRQALHPTRLRGRPDAPAAGVGELAVGGTLVVAEQDR